MGFFINKHTPGKLFLLLLIPVFFNCNSPEKNASAKNYNKTGTPGVEIQRQVSGEFKDYWYSGLAEITSYQLTQERYGELREGSAVTIFVTEDFLPEAQVKADTISERNISVLKLNSTKNFVTGIYPYSIMSSTFSPISIQNHALKISTSIQEWCGQTYFQLNNRKNFEIVAHSYFEGEADQNLKIPKTWLENELWNLIRINPEELPTGEILIIPSFEFLRLRHKKIDAYPAFASLKQGDCMTIYTINYPELQRQFIFNFKNDFPYTIEKWEELNASQSQDSIPIKTTATKMKTLRSPYWTQNSNSYSHLRDSLRLN